MYSENDFRLYHHGILGMKWGRQNGPPYPLDASDHSASEKKAGWRKSLNTSDSNDTKKHGLSSGQKKALIIGGAALATALAAYGGYRLYQSGALDGVLAKGGNAIDDFKNNRLVAPKDGSQAFRHSDKIKAVAEKTGLNLKQTVTSITEDAQVANSKAYDGNKTEWKNNCSHACMSFILRRMGLDVEATPMSSFEEGGLIFSELGHYFKGISPTHYSMPKPSSIEHAKKLLSDRLISE